MSEGKELLIEVGTEEIPARFCTTALMQIDSLMEEKLHFHRILHGRIQSMCTPRRLVVCVQGVAERQKKRIARMVGPPAGIAYDKDGNPTRAAIGFANNQGVSVEDIKVEELPDKKGLYIVVEKEDAGKETADLLPMIIPEFIISLNFPKSMRWGTGDIRFVRPIHWILALFGGTVVPFDLDGIKSGKRTFGHRFNHPEPIEINDLSSYLSLLEKAGVICDPERRKEMILVQARTAAEMAGGILKEDSALLEEVTHLVEWPVALCGSFEPKYLELPEDVLITSMRDHQRYFCIVDKKGALLPRFVTVSNTPVDDPKVIIEGNERVLRARLSDAAFFLKEDTKIPLGERIKSLKEVIFQEQLGSLYDKALRIKGLSIYLIRKLEEPIISSQERERLKTVLERSSLLCKCDLVTEMVGEFPELQGIMGREYAKRSCEQEEVAEAIYEHYLPRFSGDELPLTLSGSILSLANKMDNIAGCFFQDIIPSGSEDPHALRRQAQGIIQIILNKGLIFPWEGFIREGLLQISSKLSGKLGEVEPKIHAFLNQRLNNYFLAQGYDYDLINSVLDTGNCHPVFIQKRLNALREFRSEEAFATILISFKRVINILPKGEEIQKAVDISIFTEAEEIRLYESFQKLVGGLKEDIARAEYLGALQAMAEMKEPIDLFFDRVLVMHEDMRVRKNRLALLASIRNIFLKIADFSKIVQE